jgi:hypothetical protein
MEQPVPAAATRESAMSNLRDARRIAAAETIGRRHPWATLYGTRGLAVLVLVSVVVFVSLGLRWTWDHVSDWWASRPGPSSVPVSVSVPAGPVSWVPWWGWVLALVVLVVLIRWGIPRLRYRMRVGIWP